MSADYDALMALLRARHSCREFAPRPLAADTLDALKAAFLQAPQAGGERHVACAFLTDPARLSALADAGTRAFAALCDAVPSAFLREEMRRYGENFFWFGDVPALAVVTCRKPPAFLRAAMPAAAENKAALLWGGEPSAAMAAFALMLAAQTLGLGACCLTGPLSVWREMETRLGVPQHDALALLIALGHKKDEPQ
ncbi:MAG: nitroreductase family protein [Candidatus Accumulibacter sp.]|nr:nitroreductase family protein [Accumulibacter sp.]